MAAFLNPCGFALLPSYVSYYIGLHDRQEGHSPVGAGFLKGLALGMLVTAGFITVFGASGLLISYLGTWLVRYVPWMTILIGLTLIAIGTILLLGRSFHIHIPIAPRFSPINGGYFSFLVFGMAYAIASLSCTIPIFILVVLQAVSSGGLLSGLTIFVSYAAGMGLMMTILSVAISVSKEFVLRYMGSLMPYIGRVSGVIIILAGLYLIYFQIIKGRAFELLLQ